MAITSAFDRGFDLFGPAALFTVRDVVASASIADRFRSAVPSHVGQAAAHWPGVADRD